MVGQNASNCTHAISVRLDLECSREATDGFEAERSNNETFKRLIYKNHFVNKEWLEKDKTGVNETSLGIRP